jgi:hypothetical protein
MRIDIYHHFTAPDDEIRARLVGIQSAIKGLSNQGTQIMATVLELKAAAEAAVAAVASVGEAVNALEAKITEALASVTIPPEVQAAIDEAFASFNAIAGSATAAVADAADGVDEAKQP